MIRNRQCTLLSYSLRKAIERVCKQKEKKRSRNETNRNR